MKTNENTEKIKDLEINKQENIKHFQVMNKQIEK